jgi:hypothetical protein
VEIQIPLPPGASALPARAYRATIQDGADSAAHLHAAAASYTAGVICAAAGCGGCSAKHKWNVDGYHRQSEKVAVVAIDPKWTGRQVNRASRGFFEWFQLERKASLLIFSG